MLTSNDNGISHTDHGYDAQDGSGIPKKKYRLWKKNKSVQVCEYLPRHESLS